MAGIADPPDKAEILSYAKEIKEAYPAISDEELKKALLAKFAGGKDPLRLATSGIVYDPLSDYLSLLSITWNSLRKVFTQDKKKLAEIQDSIDEAVTELTAIR